MNAITTAAPTMSELVIVKGGEAVTTSLAIAEATNNAHESVIKLVRKHRFDLDEFSLVRFEIRPRSADMHGGMWHARKQNGRQGAGTPRRPNQ